MGDKANAHPGAAGRAPTADQPVIRTERGAGRPQRIGQDDPGRGPRADRGSGQPGGPGRGRRHRLRLRRDRAPAAALRTALPGPRRMGRVQDQSPGHPRIRRLRRGTQGRSASRGRGPFRRLGRPDGDATASTRMVWEECAAVGMPRAIVVTHLETARADFEEMTAGLRGDLRRRRPRRRAAALPAAARPAGAGRARARHRPDRAALAEAVRLLLRRAHGDARPDADAAAADRGGPQPADRGDHRRERGRDPHGPLPRRRGDRPQDAHRRPGEGRRPRRLPPRAGRRARRRRRQAGARHGRAARADHRRLPDPAGARGARRSPRPTAARARRSAATRTGRWSPRSSRPPPTRTSAGSPWSASSPAPCAPTRRSTSPGTGWPTAATRTTTSTSGSARCPRPSASSSARCRPVHRRATCACVAKLTRAETGDTLSAKDDPLLMEPWAMPDPLLPLAIQAHSKADEDKLSQGLARLVAEDPTMRLEQNQDTHQVVLWCLGEAHADVALERLRSRYGVQVDVVPHKVSLRETFGGKSAGRGRHVKQSGGHGQYAICEIEVEPLPPGSGIEFVDKVVGGAVPRQFIPSVEKGVRAQAARGRRGRISARRRTDHAARRQGALGGLLRRRVPDGGRAGAARGRGATRASICWSRWPRSACWSPDEYVGAVMSDLSGRRGRVVGTEQAGPGPHAGPGRGAGDRDRPVRRRSAVDLARHRPLRPRLRPARADAAAARRAGSREQAESGFVVRADSLVSCRPPDSQRRAALGRGVRRRPGARCALTGDGRRGPDTLWCPAQQVCGAR